MANSVCTCTYVLSRARNGIRSFHIRPEHTAYFYMEQCMCIDWMCMCVLCYPCIHMSIVCHTWRIGEIFMLYCFFHSTKIILRSKISSTYTNTIIHACIHMFKHAYSQERNFHIFYYLYAGLPEEKLKRLQLKVKVK